MIIPSLKVTLRIIAEAAGSGQMAHSHSPWFGIEFMETFTLHGPFIGPPFKSFGPYRWAMALRPRLTPGIATMIR
jgi:hypothetical protein